MRLRPPRLDKRRYVGIRTNRADSRINKILAMSGVLHSEDYENFLYECRLRSVKYFKIEDVSIFCQEHSIPLNKPQIDVLPTKRKKIIRKDVAMAAAKRLKENNSSLTKSEAVKKINEYFKSQGFEPYNNKHLLKIIEPLDFKPSSRGRPKQQNTL